MRRSRLMPVLLVAATLTGAAPACRAQATRPALEAVNAELQALFADLDAQCLRVQVPVLVRPNTTAPAATTQPGPAAANPATANPAATNFAAANAAATTAPAQAAAAEPLVAQVEATIEVIALKLDDDGRVLLPMYLDRALVERRPPLVVAGPGAGEKCGWVGTDQVTALTVLRVPGGAGKPLRIGDALPRGGSLVVMVSATRRAARLSLWTGGLDDHAVIFTADGGVGGLARLGHTLSPALMKPVIDQLVKTGEVKRAVLGVHVREVAADAAVRRSVPSLAGRAALAVLDVTADSPAARAGLRPGDLVLTLAGEPVADVASFAAAIAFRRGSTELRVLRDAAEVTATVDLQPQ